MMKLTRSKQQQWSFSHRCFSSLICINQLIVKLWNKQFNQSKKRLVRSKHKVLTRKEYPDKNSQEFVNLIPKTTECFGIEDDQGRSRSRPQKPHLHHSWMNNQDFMGCALGLQSPSLYLWVYFSISFLCKNEWNHNPQVYSIFDS